MIDCHYTETGLFLLSKIMLSSHNSISRVQIDFTIFSFGFIHMLALLLLYAIDNPFYESILLV